MARSIRVGIGATGAVLTIGVASALFGQIRGHGELTAGPAPITPTTRATATPTTGPTAAQSPDPASAPPAPQPSQPPSAAPRPADPLTTTRVLPPAATPPPAAPPPAQQRPPATQPRTAGCTTDTRSIQPARFQIPRMGVDVSMVTVGKDRDGNPGAPPLSQMFTAAWYKGSPAPNSARGNVIVNIHSWASGSALGNDLRTGLRTGDEIRVVGTDGRVACYRYREQIKIRVAAYDPASGLYQNPGGRPQLAIMTCWDRNPRTGEYESRLLFYADRVG